MQGLSRQTSPGEISRCRDKQDLGIFDQQLFPAGNDHRRFVSESLAGGTVFQMDKAESSHQNFLWDFRECSQSPNLDRRFGLSARCHHEEAAQD